MRITKKFLLEKVIPGWKEIEKDNACVILISIMDFPKPWDDEDNVFYYSGEVFPEGYEKWLTKHLDEEEDDVYYVEGGLVDEDFIESWLRDYPKTKQLVLALLRAGFTVEWLNFETKDQVEILAYRSNA